MTPAYDDHVHKIRYVWKRSLIQLAKWLIKWVSWKRCHLGWSVGWWIGRIRRSFTGCRRAVTRTRKQPVSQVDSFTLPRPGWNSGYVSISKMYCNRKIKESRKQVKKIEKETFAWTFHSYVQFSHWGLRFLLQCAIVFITPLLFTSRGSQNRYSLFFFCRQIHLLHFHFIIRNRGHSEIFFKRVGQNYFWKNIRML